MKSIGFFQIDEILPFTVKNALPANLKKKGIKKNSEEFIRLTEKEYNGVSVKMYSLRYNLFKQKGINCVCCGLKGEYFSLEQHDIPDNKDRYHFNLYGIRNGQHILITKDHIIPRSLGGKDTVNNLQAMCVECNNRKGNTNVQMIKESYDELKKQRDELLEECRRFRIEYEKINNSKVS